jgi:hypothetical protein
MLPKQWRRSRSQAPENRRMGKSIKQRPGRELQIEAKRVVSESDAANAELGSIFHQDTKNYRMQMQVQMTIDVIERQSCLVEPGKLRMHLVP